jgi:hypothetical protein
VRRVIRLLFICALVLGPSLSGGLAAESPALKRIFANWNARQARTKSFQFTWDEKQTFEKSLRYHQRQRKLWFSGENQFREEYRPCAYGGAGRLLEAFDGRTRQTLHYFGDTPLKRATIDEPQDADTSGIQPLLLVFRPSRLGWTIHNCRLVTENAIVEHGRHVQIQKVDPQAGTTESCWCDPARDDVVVHFANYREGGGTHIEYQHDRVHGWIPSAWRPERLDNASTANDPNGSTITGYAINETYPQETFAITFPAGTFIDDQRTPEFYLLRKNGSKRRVAEIELHGGGYKELLSKEGLLKDKDANSPAGK